MIGDIFFFSSTIFNDSDDGWSNSFTTAQGTLPNIWGFNLHTLEEVLVNLLSVVLWNQHIAVRYFRLLKVLKVGIQNFFHFSYTECVALVGGN